MQRGQVGNIGGDLPAVMKRRAQIGHSICAHEVVLIQTRRKIIHVNDVARNGTLRAQLFKNEIAHPKIRPEDRHLPIADPLLPLDSPVDLQWPENLVARIGSPVIAQFRRVERNFDLLRSR